MLKDGGMIIIQPIKILNDCTNYVSQCLHQGEAPMRGYPNRVNGWWMQNK